MPKSISLWLFLLMCNIFLAQQDSLSVRYDTSKITPVTISEDDLRDFRNDPDFYYEMLQSSEPEWWISFKNWIAGVFMKFFEWIFGIEKASGALNSFLKILPYVLLALLLFILIKFFINVNAQSLLNAKGNRALAQLSEEEQIIRNEDIGSLIAQAISTGNYRLAIRFNYLLILQLMTEKEIISWELQKTNEDYLMEIKNADLLDPFKTITRSYNYVWYGDFPLDAHQYEKVATTFRALKEYIGHA